MTDSNPAEGIKQKKRRVQNSCDLCRSRKIKCDSANMPGNTCTNCLSYGSICTHVAAGMSKSKRSAISKSFAKDTNSKTTVTPTFSDVPVQQLVASILSEADPYEPPTEPAKVRKLIVELANYITVLEKEIASKPDGNGDLLKTSTSPCDQDIVDEDDLAVNLNSLSLDADHCRYQPANSIRGLAKTAFDIRRLFLGGDSSEQFEMKRFIKRPHFWIDPTMPSQLFPRLEFPNMEHLLHLADLFFIHLNPFCHLLHRPTFLRLISQGTHLTDYHFGCTVLGVIALGSRYTDRQEESQGSKHAAGWRYYCQIRMGRSFDTISSVYELQLFSLASLYQGAISGPDCGFFFASQGLRLAQSVGAHKKPAPGSPVTIENELWRRAFWPLIIQDIYSSIYTGQPRATSKSDYNQHYPTECDDEYWDHPDSEKCFKQPKGKPSVMAFYIHFLKLLEILGDATGALYHTNRDVLFLPPTSHEVLSMFETRLNEWIQAIPAHLRWNPDREPGLWLEQSSMLYHVYYFARIIAHKPWMLSRPNAKSNASLQASAMAVCVDAAKSCIHVVDFHSRRSNLLMPTSTVALLHSAVVLLVNQWTNGTNSDTETATSTIPEVEQTVALFHLIEDRYQVAGRFSDILDGLIHLRQPASACHNSCVSFLEAQPAPEQNCISYLTPDGSTPSYGSQDYVSAYYEQFGQPTSHREAAPLNAWIGGGRSPQGSQAFNQFVFYRPWET